VEPLTTEELLLIVTAYPLENEEKARCNRVLRALGFASVSRGDVAPLIAA